MAEEASGSEVRTITFNVKSSADQKYAVSVPESTTVADLKQKLSTNEYADVPSDRQRLIYSGRVLKDPDTLASYKVKDGNTIHMVKQAASNTRQNPANQGSSAPVPPGSGTTNTPGGVPSNIAAGTGNDPLAGLTGARYAGFAQMPGANMFGPDGGMGPPQGPEEMLNMLENPMFASQMNEAMNNPHVIQMMQNSPMVRDQPFMREMLNNPEMRRMIMDPQFIRQSMRMQRMMGGGANGPGGAEGMPAPGVTDTTPQQQQPQGSNAESGSNQDGTQQQSQIPPNPFAMFSNPGAGGPANQANPFAALFGSNPPGGSTWPPPRNFPNPPSNRPRSPATIAREADAARAAQELTQQQNQQQAPPPYPNPFAMLGQPPQGQGQTQGQENPLMGMAQQMMQNPEMMRMALATMGMAGESPQNQGENPGGAAAGTAPGSGAGAAAAPFNPFAMLGSGAPFPAPTATQQDTRPPEEQYAEQLRQLNDMGFFDFERNVRALRMSGGRVEGAVEMLLGGGL